MKQVGLMLSRVEGIDSVGLGVQMENAAGEIVQDDSKEERKCVLRLEWKPNDENENQDVLSIEVAFGNENVSIKSDAFLPNDDVRSIELAINELDIDELNSELIRAFSRPIGMGAIIHDEVSS